MKVHCQVTFSVDEDGILSVHLRDKDTAVERGTKVKTVVQFDHFLSYLFLFQYPNK